MELTIKEFPTTERPRERLRKVGASSLSNFELLAVILRSGGPNLNVLDLARNLLAEYDNFQSLFSADLSELSKFKYLGEAKACTLKAVGEISKRYFIVEEVKKPKLNTPLKVFEMIKPLIIDKNKEFLYLLCMDLNNRLIKLSLLSIGTLTQTLADTREILKTALLKGAMSIILVHNHPSGNLDPSSEDIAFTKEIALACPYVGLNFLDHIIVTSNGYYSFKLSGLLEFSRERR